MSNNRLVHLRQIGLAPQVKAAKRAKHLGRNGSLDTELITTPTMVADQPAREAGEDRREGCQPWTLRDLPDGRSCGAATDVRRDPVADRPAAGTARPGMSGAGPSAPGNEGEKHASIQARRRVSALGRRQPPASITLLLGQRRIAVAQAAQKRDHDPKPPDIWRMSGQLRAIFTTIGIGSVEFLRLEGLSRGPEAVARALDHASSWMERRLPELIGRR